MLQYLSGHRNLHIHPAHCIATVSQKATLKHHKSKDAAQGNTQNSFTDKRDNICEKPCGAKISSWLTSADTQVDLVEGRHTQLTIVGERHSRLTGGNDTSQYESR